MLVGNVKTASRSCRHMSVGVNSGVELLSFLIQNRIGNAAADSSLKSEIIVSNSPDHRRKGESRSENVANAQVGDEPPDGPKNRGNLKMPSLIFLPVLQNKIRC